MRTRTSSRAESPVVLPEFFEVEAVEDLAMQVGFDLLVFGALEGLEVCHDAYAVVFGYNCSDLA